MQATAWIVCIVFIPTLYANKLIGGYSPINKNEPVVLEMVKFAVSSLTNSGGSQDKAIVEDILEASSQVVAGVNYKIKAKVNVAGSHQICEFIIYHVPWQGTKTVTSSRCDDVSGKDDRVNPSDDLSGLKLSDNNGTTLSNSALPDLSEIITPVNKKNLGI